MSSLLAAPRSIKTVRDPGEVDRPIREETDQLDRYSPEAVERRASEAAANVRHGQEGWAKAASLLVAYQVLYARSQVDRAYADRYQELMSAPAPMSPVRLAQLVGV